jgi:hypothetical protein
MNTPSFYTPETLKHTTQGVQAGLPDGRWVAARPEGWHGLCLRKRLRAAWLVFTGRADVLQWEGGQ